MSRPNLLLCFDAFGTLFRPKRPIIQQYGEVARQCGISDFSDDELQSSFRAAFKDEAKLNPNYGKATGLGATKWWANVIHKTFKPLMSNDYILPKDLAPKLLHRFSSKEGYEAQQNLRSALKTLKQQNSQRAFDKIVVGVVTNSDDRVPSILSSFGLNVSPLRYGTEADPSTLEEDCDIDFHCMSYDVGVEKPDKRIFDSAELMLTHIIAIRDGKRPAEIKADVEKWRKVYVGDEYTKDVMGAMNAGWSPVLLDVDGQSPGIHRLEESSAQNLDDLFREHGTVRVRSIQELTSWLSGGGHKAIS